MEPISYTTAIIWYASWPVTIYLSYLFVSKAITHLEKK